MTEGDWAFIKVLIIWATTYLLFDATWLKYAKWSAWMSYPLHKDKQDMFYFFITGPATGRQHLYVQLFMKFVWSLACAMANLLIITLGPALLSKLGVL